MGHHSEQRSISFNSFCVDLDRKHWLLQPPPPPSPPSPPSSLAKRSTFYRMIISVSTTHEHILFDISFPARCNRMASIWNVERPEKKTQIRNTNITRIRNQRAKSIDVSHKIQTRLQITTTFSVSNCLSFFMSVARVSLPLLNWNQIWSNSGPIYL